jgi:hypothetical protein
VKQRLVVHGQEIFAEFLSCVNAWKAGKYEESGKQVGYIVSKLLGTDLAITIENATPAEQFAKGALEGFSVRLQCCAAGRCAVVCVRGEEEVGSWA